MALTDINKYNILDLLPVLHFDEESQEKYIHDFSSAYADFISLQIGSKLVPQDEETFKSLLSDPLLEPTDIEDFFRERIDDFDTFLLAAGIAFKKDFLLKVYDDMVKQTQEEKDETSGVWVKITESAREDNWDNVYDLLRNIENLSLHDTVLPNHAPDTTPVAVV